MVGPISLDYVHYKDLKKSNITINSLKETRKNCQKVCNFYSKMVENEASNNDLSGRYSKATKNCVTVV